MSCLSSVDIVKEYYRRFEENDGPLMLVSSTAELRVPKSLPYGGVYRGHDEWNNFGMKFLNIWTDIKFPRVENGISEVGAFVIALLSFSGRSIKTGKCINVDVIDRIQVQDGMIISFEAFYWDTGIILQALDENYQ